MSARTWRIAGINFDHFHMGDLLRMVADHPTAQIVGISDEQPQRMEAAISNFGISRTDVFTDYRQCIEKTRPDMVVLCPSTAEHALWTERIAPFGVHILMEKPFASSLADADRMILAMQDHGRQLAINWPLRWYASHVTAYRLVRQGAIGTVQQVHFYDGNRGPLWHGADKIEKEPTAAEKDASWFYKKELGGGSLLDYLGYGTTLGTWYMDNQKPTEVTCMMDAPAGLEVDEHSITVARYPTGLSKFETRWGTFTDPWTHQPQPKCGFVIVGSDGTISSYDYEDTIRVQDRTNVAGRIISVDTLPEDESNPIGYFLACLQQDRPVDGPLSTVVSRIGQQIVDTAYQSALAQQTLPLIEQ
ncbi:MAG: Gfo/Idh/MocA family oxidoreductase [Planctomycetales bacterium]|nr:Gfo/Idh/MocA family oxidoreductase [Planctomycetales bacterium]